MKKIIVLSLVLILSLGIAGCGEDKDKAEKPKPSVSQPSTQVGTSDKDKSGEADKKNPDAQTVEVANEGELKEQVVKSVGEILEPKAGFICELYYEKGEGAVVEVMMNVADIKGELGKEGVWKAHSVFLQKISKFKGDYKYVILWNGHKGKAPVKNQERGYDIVLKTVILSEEMGRIDFKNLTPENLQEIAIEFYIDESLR